MLFITWIVLYVHAIPERDPVWDRNSPSSKSYPVTKEDPFRMTYEICGYLVYRSSLKKVAKKMNEYS